MDKSYYFHVYKTVDQDFWQLDVHRDRKSLIASVIMKNSTLLTEAIEFFEKWKSYIQYCFKYDISEEESLFYLCKAALENNSEFKFSFILDDDMVLRIVRDGGECLELRNEKFDKDFITQLKYWVLDSE